MAEPMPACPTCQSSAVVPVVYGLPSGAGREMAESGEVLLGGCGIGPESPRWHCRACGAYFGDHQEEAALVAW